MCFSATASFNAGALLAIVGALTVYHTTHRRWYPLAVIPIFFALQQFCEGFVWLNIDGTIDTSSQLAAQLFLSCSLALWPVWIPFSLALVEPVAKRRSFLWRLTTLGGFYALISLWFIYAAPPEIEPVSHHLVYYFSIPNWLVPLGLIFYLLATILPFFISSWPFKSFGVAVFISFLVTYFFWYTSLISLWCFIAALLSVCIAYLIQRMEILYLAEKKRS